MSRIENSYGQLLFTPAPLSTRQRRQPGGLSGGRAGHTSRLGFADQGCIHQSQIALANKGFRPADGQIAPSLKVVESTRAFLADGRDVFAVDAQLLDGPFIAHTTQTIAAAKQLGLVQ